MKNYKIYILLSMIFVNISFEVTQAAQRDESPINFAQLFPQLAEGFDVLRANYYHDTPDFQDYAQEKLANAEIEGDDPLGFGLLEGLGDLTNGSEDMIFGMKARFLGVLGWATDQHIANLDEVQDPVFRYVMKYREDFLKPVIREWVNQKTTLGIHFVEH